jgi:hypothetical protein
MLLVVALLFCAPIVLAGDGDGGLIWGRQGSLPEVQGANTVMKEDSDFHACGDGDGGLIWGRQGSLATLQEAGPDFHAFGDGDGGLIWGRSSSITEYPVLSPIDLLTSVASRFGMMMAKFAI